MGFLDFCKSAVEFAAEKNQKMQQDYDKYYDRMDRLDDEALKRKYKSSSGIQKVAAASLLKERGYGKK